MNKEENNEYDKLFVGGDLSGIQKFLYNITSKNAAVSLKGRSYFLRKYMESVCDEMMKLSSVASAFHEVIYCSGGKFYAIIQNSQRTQEELKDFAIRIKGELWNEHYGQLSINFSFVPFHEHLDGSIDVLGQKNQTIGLLWRCVTEDFARQKNQKFLDQIKTDYDSFFEVTPVGATPKVCAVTGIESDKCVPVDNEDRDETIFVLPSVKKQILLGRQMRAKEQFRTFEEYADESYLGILRMDVDGLGTYFANGFSSFKEYKEKSAHLDAFFTSRADHTSNLQQIQQKEYYRDHLCIIYAGGDDIFAVGRWDKVIDFAAEVQEAFANYVDDERITLSGGIAIVHPKFPIAKAAELAGEAEDSAKKYVYEDIANNIRLPKNAFCMFGKSISWKYEFDYVEHYKNEFVRLISPPFNMPRGILHKIMSYAAIVERNTVSAESKDKDYSYIWHTAYYLTRMIERVKEPQIIEFCKKLRDKELLYGSDNEFRLMAIAARWAELTLRINK